MQTYVFLMTMVDGDGVSYGLNVQGAVKLDGTPIITWPWAGGAGNELWAIQGDGSVASAMIGRDGNPIYLGVDPDTNAVVLSSDKYYWTIGVPGSVGAITASDGTVITVDPSQPLEGTQVTLAPAALTDAIPGPQSWWAAPNILQVVPQFTAWRYVASALTDSNKDTYVLTSQDPTGDSDGEAILLQPMTGSSPAQLWQVTPDGKLVSGTSSGLTIGLAALVNGVYPLETQWSISINDSQNWTFSGAGLIANKAGGYLTIDGQPNSLSPYDAPQAVVAELPDGTPPASFLWQLAPGNPLAGIVAQPPTPFILFEGLQAEIYAHLMSRLGTADLRLEYPLLTSPLASYQTTIAAARIPPLFLGYQEDWYAVVDQLTTELRNAQTVGAYFAQYNDYQTDLQTYFDGQLGSLGAMANLQQGSSTSVGGVVLSIFEGIAYAALEAVPGGAEAVSLASIVGNVMEMAVNVGTNSANVTTSISPSPYAVAFSEFQQMVDQNFVATLEASGTMQTVILSDPGRMAAFYAAVQARGADCLSWPAGQTGNLVNQARSSLQISILQALLPSTYEIFYEIGTDGAQWDDVPAACQWVTPIDNGKWGKFKIASQQDWTTYPDAGMMQQYIWNNGVKPSDFFMSQNGWSFPVACLGDSYQGGVVHRLDEAGGRAGASLVLSNQTPFVIWVQLNTKNTGGTTQLFGYNKIGPAGSTAVVAIPPSADGSLSFVATISILEGENIAGFTVNMDGWGAPTPSRRPSRGHGPRRATRSRHRTTRPGTSPRTTPARCRLRSPGPIAETRRPAGFTPPARVAVAPPG